MIASWHSKSLVSLDTSQVEWPNGLLFKWRFVRPKCRTIGRLAEGKKESLVSPSNGAAQQKGCNAHANSGPSQQNNNSTKICEISVLWLWVKVWLVSLLLNLKFNTQAEWPWSWVEIIQKCSKGVWPPTHMVSQAKAGSAAVRSSSSSSPTLPLCCSDELF